MFTKVSMYAATVGETVAYDSDPLMLSAPTLVTDNPGCLLRLRGAADVAHDRFVVRHVAEVLADAVASARAP